LTGAASDAGQLAVDVGFKLEEVQMAPTALAMVMDFLLELTTGRTWRTVGTPDYVQGNSAACDIQCNTINLPGGLQAQRLTKQRFLHSCSSF
jgi:hypothetical protein